ncbi:hypothetical protein OSL69_23725, partial [Escherichia coli]|nr:hypothetical protein [Escherichia coli]
KTSIFSHPVYLFLRKFSLQDSRGGSESLHHSQLTATIDQFNPVFNSSSQIMDKYYGSLSGVLNEINNEITQQSLSISANEIFRMAAIAFILLTVLVWFAKPPFTAKGVG